MEQTYTMRKIPVLGRCHQGVRWVEVFLLLR
jgi:hypothetical protein